MHGGVAQAAEFLRRPTTRLLITLVAEAVEPGSSIHGFYAELHRTMRKWTATWLDSIPVPGGIYRDDYATILLATVIGIHQQWQVAPEDVELERALATFLALVDRLGQG